MVHHLEEREAQISHDGIDPNLPALLLLFLPKARKEGEEPARVHISLNLELPQFGRTQK